MSSHFKSCDTSTNCWCEIKRYGVLFGIAAMILLSEIVGGIVSHSLALLADAGHVFVDICAILVSIIVSYRVKCGANETRTRQVGGYINLILLGGIATWVLVEAIKRFQEPKEVVSWVMFFIAVAGTIGNLVMREVMKRADEDNVTRESMRLHINSDLIQSVGVVVGGSLIWITNWILIDPIFSMAIALWMGTLTWKLLKKLRSGKYDSHHHHH